MTKLPQDEKILMHIFNRKLKKNNGQYFYEDSVLQCNIPVATSLLHRLYTEGYVDAEYKALTADGRKIIETVIRKNIEGQNARDLSGSVV